MSDIKKAVSSAVVKLLAPLVKILLRNGIPYGTFCELAKGVYVDVASKEFAIPGRKQTISRVAIITGLSRKEVRRVQQIPASDDFSAADRYNRAVRVISGWKKDPRFHDKRGRPGQLLLEGEGITFSSLVKSYSGDIPPRAVLDEMLRAGVVEMIKGRIRLLAGGYIIRKGEIEKINIMGADVSELISTINHNLEGPPDGAFLQRKVSYDNIPLDVLSKLREEIAGRSEKFIESMDRLIAEHDRDSNPSLRGKGRKKAGLGIYYFE